MATTTYTVREGNEVLGSAKFVGTFDTLEDALSYIERRAQQCRNFATFEAWTGNPRNPRTPASNIVRGQE